MERAGAGALAGDRRRRGSILLAVAVVVVLATLVGATVVYRADVQRARAGATRDGARLRAVAWSGVQAVMAELGAQRGALMASGTPRLTTAWDVSTVDGVRGTVRLAVQPAGGIAVAEAGRLDLNSATEAMLAMLPGVGEGPAAAMVAGRGVGYVAPEALCSITELDAEDLYRGDDGAEGRVAGLLEMVTVFGAEPNVQSGVGAGGSGGNDAGEARVMVREGWDDALRSGLVRRLGEIGGGAAEALLRAGGMARESDAVRILSATGVPVSEWAGVIDVLGFVESEFVLGRTDLNSALAEVLACIPGIDAEGARRIVAERGALDEPTRARVTWPVERGILTPERFADAVDFLTTRCLQWRVRVEAGFGRQQEGAGDVEQEVGRPGLVYEAVIDVAGDRPRVAYLRDVTHLGLALRDVREAASGGDVGAGEARALAPDGAAETASPKSDADTMPLDLDGGLDLGGGLDLETGLDLGIEAESGAAVSSGSARGSAAPAAARPGDGRLGRWAGPRRGRGGT